MVRFSLVTDILQKVTSRTDVTFLCGMCYILEESICLFIKASSLSDNKRFTVPDIETLRWILNATALEIIDNIVVDMISFGSMDTGGVFIHLYRHRLYTFDDHPS